MDQQRRILVTGACGNIGKSTLLALAQHGHCKIIGFDLATPSNEVFAQRNQQIEWVWGDIRSSDDINRAVALADTVIHLVSIIPPMSEIKPDFATAVNVQGTINLVRAMEASSDCKRLIFTSSMAVHGVRCGSDSLLSAESDYAPHDCYSINKVDSERYIRDTSLDWTICRLAAIPDTKTKDNIKLLIEDIRLSLTIGQRDRIEFCHTRNVGIALTNAALEPLERVQQQIFMIGGGSECRLLGYDFVRRMSSAGGLPNVPKQLLPKEPRFYGGWVDSETSNAVLNYQKYSFDDFLDELGRELGWKRYAARPFASVIWWLCGKFLKAH